MGRSFYSLAAAAVVVAAATVVAHQAVVAAAAGEQNDQDDDPPAAVAAPTIVTHIEYLQDKLAAEPLIPRYSANPKRCLRFLFQRRASLTNAPCRFYNI